MIVNALLAALCLVPLAASMYIGSDFGYDPPDQKIFRRNAFGQIQAFDVSHETKLVPNAFGGLSHYNVMGE
ncbi:hypothetical protein PoB_006425600 [Plakobranchus ocellatus]|uniref:Uncharacterized protein n=1 Tax=Plakobranchus ocellatus TaxID=259542 RepID=A0AAV4D0L3_9GAST|nr:hypothetical protein PoB_006425600 [Plakobranchus ocellatus]